MKIVALEAFTYADLPRKAGDVFDVEDNHVRILTEGYQKKAKRYQTAAMSTETASEIVPEPKRRGRPPKNFYNRADIRATET